jgi:Domain of unknown function DUF29
MCDPDWQEDLWFDSRAQARNEADLAEGALPEACPWSIEQAADPDFWPE